MRSVAICAVGDFTLLRAVIGRAILKTLMDFFVEPPSPVLDQQEQVNVYQALQCVASLITDVEHAKKLARQQVDRLFSELEDARRERDQALFALHEIHNRLKLLVGKIEG